MDLFVSASTSFLLRIIYRIKWITASSCFILIAPARATREPMLLNVERQIKDTEFTFGYDHNGS